MRIKRFTAQIDLVHLDNVTKISILDSLIGITSLTTFPAEWDYLDVDSCVDELWGLLEQRRIEQFERWVVPPVAPAIPKETIRDLAKMLATLQTNPTHVAVVLLTLLRKLPLSLISKVITSVDREGYQMLMATAMTRGTIIKEVYDPFDVFLFQDSIAPLILGGVIKNLYTV